MPRFAAIDVGTNTVLMVVAERGLRGRLFPVLEREEITRLGEGVDGTRRLSPQAMERTAAVLCRFAEEARAEGVRSFAVGATSAARDAANGSELVALIRERARLELEILRGEEEARLTFRAVQEDFGAGASALVALDIGGGSTEVVWGAPRGAPAFHQSVNVGSVRLTERFVSRHPIPEAERRAIREHVRESFALVPRPPPGARVVAVAATATSLSMMAPRLVAGASGVARGDPSDPLASFAPLQRPALESLVEKLCDMSVEERIRIGGLNPRRADVICAGAFILIEALDRLGVSECQVSDRGVRWGLLWERFGEPVRRARC
jgi:exopolyphosphatase / guanosine-5'-triphosphate,3'-diphosphate pyrophosphatase